ncbi:MAG: hypothetical protein AUG44_22410 [Actinobacteria bacterium 13_1_20CM_3_71_11]|nr:MAG: hypothetical protein AUG44_22410 [Actinobacteria bacterium 13_1_20CM_3_71_11]
MLYTSATNGTNRQNVYTAPAGEYLTATSWSPDGSTIAVVHPVGTTGTGVLGFAPSGTRLWTINTPGSCGSEIAWARDSESFFQLACTAGSHTGTIYRYPATSNAQPATIGFDHVLAGLAVGR